MPNLFAPSVASVVRYTPELARVADLPRRSWTPAEAEELAEKMTNILKTKEGTMRLRPVQALALYDVGTCEGLFAPMAVGSGKTLVSFLAPEMRGAQRPLLLVPAKLVDKTERDRRELARHWKIGAFMRVMTYEFLGQPQNAEAFEKFQPDFVVADECFVYETLVLTDVGWVPIGDLVEFGKGRFVLSYSVSGSLEWKRIVRRLRRKAAQLVKVTHDYGSFVCTSTHRIWTERGYVEAGLLCSNDKLLVVRNCGFCTEEAKDSQILFESMHSCCNEREGTATACEKICDDSMSALWCGIFDLCSFTQKVLFVDMSLYGSQAKQDYLHCVSWVRKNCLCGETRKGDAETLFACVFDSDTYENTRGATQSCRAISETAHYQELCGVRQPFFFSFTWKEQRETSILYAQLREPYGTSAVHGRTPACISGENVTNNARPFTTGCSRKDASQQPYSRSSSPRENISHASRSHFFGTWRQWQAHETSVDVARVTQAAHGVRHRDSSGERITAEFAEFLSCRPRGSDNESCYRGRWEESQDPQVAFSGSSEDAGTRSSRVVRVEVLERNSFRGHRESGRADSFVYDLEVEDNHNYFADGVLVSNCHKLRNPKAAVTRRVRRFFAQQHVPFVAMSGTMTKRSLLDFAHLMSWVYAGDLEKMPLPRIHHDLEMWADAVDERKGQTRRADPGALECLCDEQERQQWQFNRRGAARSAIRRRLVETAGVVATTETPVDATLAVEAVEPPQPKAVEDAFRRLRSEWVTPDGWPLTDGIEVRRHALELAVGMFYVWDPRPPDIWLERRAAWAKHCRKTLSHSHKLDTEAQVRRHVEQSGGCKELTEWLAVRDMFTPNTKPVWLTDDVLKFAADWSRREGGIVWVEHVAFGERLERDFGLPYYGRQGRDRRGKYIEDHPAGEAMAASIASSGEGRNLQAWNRNLVTTWPANGKGAEQLLGRTHREGQNADEVYVEFFESCAEHVLSFWQSHADCCYVLETTGSPQKLLLASTNVRDFDDLTKQHPRWDRDFRD